MTSWYDAIPKPVRTLFERSWDDLQAKVPGTSATKGDLPKRRSGTLGDMTYETNVHIPGNLDSAFYSGKHPTSCQQAVEAMSLADVNIIIILFERMAAISASVGHTEDHLTEGIRWIRGTWCRTSAGFGCRFFDRIGQKNLYREYVGNGLVDEGSLSGGDHPGCDCWRENPPHMPNGGVHFVMGNRQSVLTIGNEDALDSIHLDWTVPCSRRATTHCELTRWDGDFLEDVGRVVTHVAQAVAGFGEPISPLKLTQVLQQLNEQVSKLRKSQGEAGVQELKVIESQWLLNQRN